MTWLWDDNAERSGAGIKTGIKKGRNAMANGDLNRAGKYVYEFPDHNKVNRAAALVASAKDLLVQAMYDKGPGYPHAVKLYNTCLEMEPDFARHGAAENGREDLPQLKTINSPGQLKMGGRTVDDKGEVL